MNQQYLYIFLMLILLTSCEETIQLDLDQVEPKIVVEGLLTNRLGDQYVKVTKTVDFYASGGAEKITNANIKLIDDLGEEYSFNQTSPGYYLPVVDFAGVVGRSYSLSVEVDGVFYQSEDQLLRVPEIDSLGYSLNGDPDQDRIDSGHLYDLLLYMKEPKETTDYYLFKFYRNDSLTFTNANDIYLLTDEALSESISGFPGPVYYAEQDTARMDMFSVTRNGYVYFSDLTNLLFNDGGLFGPVPANPRSNMSNGALGFFQVSAVTTTQVILKKKN
jgi:hypothetical protein